MKKLTPEQCDSLMKSVSRHPCGSVYPLSVLENRQFGEAFGDGESALLWHYCGFTYLFGRCDEAFLERVYSEFLIAEGLSRRFVLFVQEGSAEQFFKSKQGLSFGIRYGFEYASSPAELPTAMPDGCQLQSLDDKLFDTLDGRVTPRFSWRDKEQFEQGGAGFCVVCDGIPASWAFSAAVSSDEVDIGVETTEHYRHKSLAALAAEQMIEYTLLQGKRPVWACDSGNTASRKLAEKLGFSVTAQYITIRKNNNP